MTFKKKGYDKVCYPSRDIIKDVLYDITKNLRGLLCIK